MAEIYRVQRVDEKPDWTSVAKAMISNYGWVNPGYELEAWGQVVFWNQKGFLVRMSCREDDPKAIYTKENETVCKDSCLEFFADFLPGGETGYMNCEANAKGTLLCGVGKERAGRKKLKDMGIKRPEVTPFREGEVWGYELFIPLSLVEELYHKTDWKSGDEISANFYKCGDETAIEHYGMWQKIEWHKPDFHRPEQFGKLVIA